MGLLGRGSSQERRCLSCRIRKKRCVFNARDDMCQDCGKFWIECTGVGAPRPSSNCEKEIIDRTKKWIKGKKTVDRTKPPLSLTSIIQKATHLVHAHAPNRETSAGAAPASEEVGTPHPRPLALTVSELDPNSEPADPSVLFPELPPQGGSLVWEDMQHLTLAPMFYNLHHPTGLIRDLVESPTSPVRIVLESTTGDIDGNFDDPGFPEACTSGSNPLTHTIYENISNAGSGSSFNDLSNTTGTPSTSEFRYDFFEGRGSEYSHGGDNE